MVVVEAHAQRFGVFKPSLYDLGTAPPTCPEKDFKKRESVTTTLEKRSGNPLGVTGSKEREFLANSLYLRRNGF